MSWPAGGVTRFIPGSDSIHSRMPDAPTARCPLPPGASSIDLKHSVEEVESVDSHPSISGFLGRPHPDGPLGIRTLCHLEITDSARRQEGRRGRSGALAEGSAPYDRRWARRRRPGLRSAFSPVIPRAGRTSRGRARAVDAILSSDAMRWLARAWTTGVLRRAPLPPVRAEHGVVVAGLETAGDLVEERCRGDDVRFRA